METIINDIKDITISWRLPWSPVLGERNDGIIFQERLGDIRTFPKMSNNQKNENNPADVYHVHSLVADAYYILRLRELSNPRNELFQMGNISNLNIVDNKIATFMHRIEMFLNRMNTVLSNDIDSNGIRSLFEELNNKVRPYLLHSTNGRIEYNSEFEHPHDYPSDPRYGLMEFFRVVKMYVIEIENTISLLFSSSLLLYQKQELIDTFQKYPNLTDEFLKKRRCFSITDFTRTNREKHTIISLSGMDCGYLQSDIDKALKKLQSLFVNKTHLVAYQQNVLDVVPLDNTFGYVIEFSKVPLCYQTDLKEHFTCCERKTIPYIHQNYSDIKSFKMFVKYKPCGRCEPFVSNYMIKHRGKVYYGFEKVLKYKNKTINSSSWKYKKKEKEELMKLGPSCGIESYKYYNSL